MTSVLITNDDGIDSPGLHALAAAALEAGLDVTVAAPSWDSSGASASLTGVRKDGRLLVEARQLPGLDVPAFAVEAAPAMIALTALRGGFGDEPDMVLSGVNRGRNTGHAVLHSGTVGAPLTAVNDGACGMAVSIDAADPRHWATARRVAVPIIEWVAECCPRATVNVNVPDLPFEELAGVCQAPLAAVGAVQTNVTDVTEGYVQLTFGELSTKPEPGTDAAALAEGWAVVTPIQGIAPAEADMVPGLDDLIGRVPAGAR